MTFLTYAHRMFVGSLICGRIVDFYAKSSPAAESCMTGAPLDGPANRFRGSSWFSFGYGFRNEDRAATSRS